MSDPGYIKPTGTSANLAWRNQSWPVFSINTIDVGHTDYVGGIRTQYSGLAAWSEPGVAKLFQLAAGGHAIDNSNAVMMLDLYVDAPAWVIDRAPSSAPVQAEAFNWGSTHPGEPDPHHYSDGEPCSSHTYMEDCFINVPGHGPYAIRLQQFATHPAASSSRLTDVYDANAKAWILPVGTAMPSSVPSFGFGGALGPPGVCQDPRNHNIYFADGNIFNRFNTSTWAWENLGFTVIGGSYAPTCIDTIHNKWYVIIGNASDRGATPGEMYNYDIGTGARDHIMLVPDASNSGLFYQGKPYYYEYNGVAFDEDNGLIWYVTGANTNTVYTIDPLTGQCVYRGLCAPCSSGPETRLRYFKELGGIFYQSDSVAQFFATR